MKRFHVHVGVENLDRSVAFSSGLLEKLASANAAAGACCTPEAPVKPNLSTSCC